MAQIIPIEGSTFSDARGNMKFFNTFDMKAVVRFYEISPANTEIIRGWQGHQKERKWFYCHTGAFMVQVVHIGARSSKENDIFPERFELRANVPIILEVPAGNATAFKATEEGSKLMVFSDFTLQESIEDDLRFPLETWNVQW